MVPSSQPVSSSFSCSSFVLEVLHKRSRTRRRTKDEDDLGNMGTKRRWDDTAESVSLVHPRRCARLGAALRCSRSSCVLEQSEQSNITSAFFVRRALPHHAPTSPRDMELRRGKHSPEAGRTPTCAIDPTSRQPAAPSGRYPGTKHNVDRYAVAYRPRGSATAHTRAAHRPPVRSCWMAALPHGRRRAPRIRREHVGRSR